MIKFMSKDINHPGVFLNKLLVDKGISQREFASKINIAHSLLNNILKGNRNININIAISLESARMKTADYWLKEQMKYSLYLAKNNEEIIKKNECIKIWNDLEELVPISFFKKQGHLESSSLNDDINKIYEIYEVEDIRSLKHKVNTYQLSHFRKSSKFPENERNIIAWSLLAKYKAKQEELKPFSKTNEGFLINELKRCFLKNENTLSKSKEILNKYGIKFFILDRPPKTPVDGKSFMSGKSPAIVLSLKYKRLDNFAFTLFHEIGHVFKHLITPKYKGVDFFVNGSNEKFEEFEANIYARNHLIDSESWSNFINSNSEFNDEVINKFSTSIKVHPSIIRGRVCFEYPEYYKKRSAINRINYLTY